MRMIDVFSSTLLKYPSFLPDAGMTDFHGVVTALTELKRASGVSIKVFRYLFIEVSIANCLCRKT